MDSSVTLARKRANSVHCTTTILTLMKKYKAPKMAFTISTMTTIPLCLPCVQNVFFRPVTWVAYQEKKGWGSNCFSCTVEGKVMHRNWGPITTYTRSTVFISVSGSDQIHCPFSWRKPGLKVWTVLITCPTQYHNKRHQNYFRVSPLPGNIVALATQIFFQHQVVCIVKASRS